MLACPCSQHVTGHSWGQKPSSTRAPVCSVPLGPGLGVAYSSPAPCPALVVTCAFDPCPPEPLIYTNISCFQKKSSKRKKLVTYKGNSITLSEDFSEKLARVAQYTQSDEIWKKKKIQPITSILSGKVIIQNWRREKELSRQAKAKGDNHHWTNLIKNVKGTF